MDFAQAARGVLQFGARVFRFDIGRERIDFLPQLAQRRGDRVVDEFRLAHAAFLGVLTKVGGIADLIEKKI